MRIQWQLAVLPGCLAARRSLGNQTISDSSGSVTELSTPAISQYSSIQVSATYLSSTGSVYSSRPSPSVVYNSSESTTLTTYSSLLPVSTQTTSESLATTTSYAPTADTLYTTTDITITACQTNITSCSTTPISSSEQSTTPVSSVASLSNSVYFTSTTNTTAPVASTPSISTKPSNYVLPKSQLSNDQQVGNSTFGALCQPTFPKWLVGSNDSSYIEAPWGNRTTKNADATVLKNIPITNITRYYDFEISRGRISPDGVLRDVILVNGQFPAPLIEANWGDVIQVTVRNNITDPEEGTSMHWHGMLQRGTQWQDGVPGVSQCPIAPGQSYTYSFRAELFGSSFYHAHYSAQFTAGVIGPMQIYGPSQLDYDIDMGPVMLSNWNHIPYFSMVNDVVSSNFSAGLPASDSGLINGRGRFNCSQPSYSNSTEWLGSNLRSNITWTCVDGAERAKFRFQSGKTHRLRLMNMGADGELLQIIES